VARQTAVSKQNTAAYAQSALAVGEVKPWEVNLSKKTGTQPTFDDQNPMYQIDTYLSLTGLEWEVLSNGRIWRLLHKNMSRTPPPPGGSEPPGGLGLFPFLAQRRKRLQNLSVH